jgi:hypothetical protein
MKTSSVLSFLLFLGLLLNCKKSETNPDKSQIISSKQWKVTAYTVYPPRDPYEDGNYTSDLYNYAYYDDCKKNARHIFRPDGNGQIDYPCEYVDETFTWSVTAGGTKLKLFGNDYDILTLDETTLIIRTNQEVYPIYTMTFKSLSN